MIVWKYFEKDKIYSNLLLRAVLIAKKNDIDFTEELLSQNCLNEYYNYALGNIYIFEGVTQFDKPLPKDWTIENISNINWIMDFIERNK